MNEVGERLRNFAVSLLERHGALVDWPTGEAAEGLAVLPPGVAEHLHSPEEVRLTHEAVPNSGAPPCLSVNLATDFLEHVEPLVAAEPRAARLRIAELYLKKAAMDEPVARMFAWPNARVRLHATRGVRAEYHTWYFLARLESDERWEELVRITVHPATGAVLSLPDPLGLGDAQEDPETPPLWPADLPLARRRAAELAQMRAADFVERLEGRLERDRRRIRDYYQALLDEDNPAHARHPVAPQRAAERRRAVELELRRKLLELDERYALRPALEPLALVRLDMPALLVECQVARRQARGACPLYWNALRKELEPLACRACGQNITAVHFDERIRPLCGACAGQ